ncbi:unnamed protein product, partial [Iphiclides podalirius]
MIEICFGRGFRWRWWWRWRGVVVRNPRRSAGRLLADAGDGAEADLLGTTPPRARIRDKEKRRPIYRSNTDVEASLQRARGESAAELQPPPVPERLKKRASLKLMRARERDWKQELGEHEPRADSLPSPGPAEPTLVESCSRFMSLSSRLKSRAEEAEQCQRWPSEQQLPPSRVSFHNTFSLLINMGNADKGCKRTISREEQVWQNELKDLIWLALQARLAGRSLPQQDAYLCAQRDLIPGVVDTILNYKFVNPFPCPAAQMAKPQIGLEVDEDIEPQTCLCLECARCCGSIGAAMREVSSLLEAFYGAADLYPSSSAAEADQPSLARPQLKHRVRAMCVWFNAALHMRQKLESLRRMLRSASLARAPPCARRLQQLASSDSDLSGMSSEGHRPCQVQFDVSNTPTDSSSSDASAHCADKSRSSDEVSVNLPTGCAIEHKRESTELSNEEKNTEEVRGVDNNEEGTNGSHEHREDVVDSGIDSRSDTLGDTTPEIWQPEEQDQGAEGADDPLQLGSLHELAQLRLLGRTHVPLYRDYQYEMLKTQGVRRCMTFIHKICYKLLRKVYFTLLPENVELDSSFSDEFTESLLNSKSESHDKNETKSKFEDAFELRRYGCWSPETVGMRLPWFRSHFVLLGCVCMEAMHDYLALRLETRPAHPSCLTVKQLIHELKEGLDLATEIRSGFVRYAFAALRGLAARSAQGPDLLRLLRTFDATVETALQQYLSYLSTMSETEALPRSALAAEWAFTARLAARAPRAAAAAPPAFVDIACKQLRRLVRRFDERFDGLEEMVSSKESEGPRYVVFAVCRAAQEAFVGEREAVLQAAQAARALAARLPLRRAAHRAPLLGALVALRDCLVRHTERILERSRLPAEEAADLSDGTAARVRELLLQAYKLGFELHRELYALAQAPRRHGWGGRGAPRGRGRGRPSSLQPPPPPRPPPAAGARRRPDTVVIHESVNPLLHKELHRFVNESWGRNGPSAPSATPGPPGPGAARAERISRSKLLRSESIIEEGVFDYRIFEGATESTKQNDLEELLASAEGWAPAAAGVAGGVEGEGGVKDAEGEEGVKVEGGAEGEECGALEEQWAAQVARAIIEFARCWMRFVMERCERGRGLRPRWASQGLEFLMLACDPWNTKHLSDEEFEELKQLMDACISHVIGSRPAAPADPPRRPKRALHSPSASGAACREPQSPPAEGDAPALPQRDRLDHAAGCARCGGRAARVALAVALVEREREGGLRARGAVGRPLPAAPPCAQPKLRQLAFKWQRGLKIGAGSFGKVYTVVNTESGQLLAMKELSVCAADRRALQRAANELRLLEGVLHPHLVRYYGCELHREELLLFMELCVEGSLEALVGAAGALPEHTARRYAKQLLSAVAELHARGIVHRDIKSGNVFLTNEGHCLKLGDFGCAVKIRANTTAPGELQGFVGTQAYMAPEVFMKSSGHGRAADIWSLGCVVTEMASGRRPFAEYDSNYQIMFVVGMGGRPLVPDALSEEGQEFCRLCLTHDPELRPRADALALHHFLMVKSDDDCKCESAYLMA